MKKFLIVLTILCVVLCSSCYQDLYADSLDEYTTMIRNSKVGNSATSIDNPYYFLPSCTFLVDYPYEEGGYVWREDDIVRGLFTTNVFPEIALLALQYDEQTYLSAKQTMLDEIPAYTDQVYMHGGFIFYENANCTNFINFKEKRNFPQWFTMAGYNDEKNTLMFIGMYSGTLAGPSCLEERFLNDIENNFSDFIDTYYGQYYDFNE